jgi:hypothetical protein
VPNPSRVPYAQYYNLSMVLAYKTESYFRVLGVPPKCRNWRKRFTRHKIYTSYVNHTLKNTQSCRLSAVLRWQWEYSGFWFFTIILSVSFFLQVCKMRPVVSLCICEFRLAHLQTFKMTDTKNVDAEQVTPSWRILTNVTARVPVYEITFRDKIRRSIYFMLP